jgi:nitrite reductase/ring-hydroxylating ferredoxin subunit
MGEVIEGATLSSALFEVTTGQVVGPPAPQSVPTYKVVVKANGSKLTCPETLCPRKRSA